MLFFFFSRWEVKSDVFHKYQREEGSNRDTTEGDYCRLSGGKLNGDISDSQALFGQGSGHVVGQRGQLRRLQHVDASGRGHVAVPLRGGPAWQPERLDHNLCPVIHACFGCVAEQQLMAFNLRKQEVGDCHLAHPHVRCGIDK